jgi:SAM-dependent methyltransferase
MTDQIDSIQSAQEEEYSFPYHYIPVSDDGGFSQALYWPWGYRYLGGLHVVFKELERMSFRSLLDVGCGDGRFPRELSKRYPDVRVVGVDYSERSIHMARAMNPALDFLCRDITREEITETFEVSTAIEVLEHIPTEQLDLFVKAVAHQLEENGRFIVTVPHKNKPLQRKHFQHFTGKEITRILSPHFKDFHVIPFDPHSPLLKKMEKFIGGFGGHFLVTNRTVLSSFFRLYTGRYLYSPNEKRCRRIAITCKKK